MSYGVPTNEEEGSVPTQRIPKNARKRKKRKKKRSAAAAILFDDEAEESDDGGRMAVDSEEEDDVRFIVYGCICYILHNRTTCP